MSNKKMRLVCSTLLACTIVSATASISSAMTTPSDFPAPAEAPVSFLWAQVESPVIEDYVEVPAGADVKQFTLPDGATMTVVSSKADSATLLAADALAPGTSRIINSGTTTTLIAAPRATCSQSSSVSDPILRTAVQRNVYSSFSYTRSSGCEWGQTWYANLIAPDPIWGYNTSAQQSETVTKPGYTDSVYMSYICKGSATKKWHANTQPYNGTPFAESVRKNLACSR